MINFPSRYTEKQKRAALALQRTLDNMDFRRYNGRVVWRLQMPECSVYIGIDGNPYVIIGKDG